MFEDNDAPLDPVKVAAFALLLGVAAFGGWRYWRARAAVAAVAEASKDYRRLFPSRSAETSIPAPRPVAAAEAPVSGMAMLKIDDDMRAPKPAEPKPQPPAQVEAAPVAVVKVKAAALVKPAKKTFRQPRLNSGAFSGLNGGAGIGFSGGSSAAPVVDEKK